MGVMDARGAYHVVPAVAGTVLALLLLTGGQGDADPSDTGTAGQPSASAAPTAAEASGTPSPASSAGPSPASSLGPAANLPVPVKPALADENSKEGLEAFTRYWLALFSRGYETNEWAEFQDVTDANCRTCANVATAVDDVFASGGWIVGGETELTDFSTDFRRNTEGSVSAVVQVEQGASQVYLESGALESDEPESDSRVNLIFAVHNEGRWLMLDFGAPEGTE
jgi:hypothetical protein